MSNFLSLRHFVRLGLLLLILSLVASPALALSTKSAKTIDKPSSSITTIGGGTFLNKLVGGGNTAEPLSKQEQGKLLLKEMKLESNTEPKAFSVQPKDIPTILFAALPAVFRLFTGALAEGYGVEIVRRDPSKYTILPLGDRKQIQESSTVQNSIKDVTTMEPIVLYDREGDASCRLVREACSILSLTVQILPCPKNGVTQKKQVLEQELPLPTLCDPNTGIELRNYLNKANVEDDDALQIILSYLFKTYGNGQVPRNFDSNFAAPSSFLAMACRFGQGSSYQTSDPPEEPVTLWSYESSPFCKIVTETLGSLEIVHNVIYTPRGSPNRQRMLEEYGRFQVPFLVDPNTGVELWESSAICEYLKGRYGARTTVTYL